MKTITAGDPYDAVGDVISYEFQVSNSGNVALLGPVTIDDDKAVDEDCPAVSTVGNLDAYLDPGESITCSASYTVDQDDLNAGSVTNRATASADGTTSNEDSAMASGTQNAALSIVKAGSLNLGAVGEPDVADPGDVINYTFEVTNDGNVNLTHVSVTDPLVSTITCPGGNPIPSLAPGASETCTGSYAITEGDIDAGAKENTATADSDQTDPVQSTHTQPIPQNLVLSLVKDGALDLGPHGTADPGDVIDYTFEVSNDGNTTLTNVGITDPDVPSISCRGGNPIASLAPGASETCTGSYAITQVDIDAGQKVNTATAGSDQTGTVDSSHTEPIPQSSVLSLVKGGALDLGADGVASPGDLINYTFLVSSDGNTTLTIVSVTDPDVSPVTCPSGNPIPSLAPGVSETCTGSYAISQADIDTGQKVNTATANSDQTDPVDSSHTEPIPQSFVLSLVKGGALDLGADGVANPGDLINYTFLVSNGGNALMTNVGVTDPDVSPITCPSGNPIPSLAPGASETCTGSYAISQADIDIGQKVNTATANSDQTDPVTSDLTIPIPRSSTIRVVKSSTTIEIIAAAEVVPYSFLVTNEGNVTLTGITVTDARCNAAPAYQSGDTNGDNELGLDEAWTYTCDHTVTQTEIDTGGDLSNTVTADSTESGPDTDTLNIPIAEYTLTIFRSGLGTVLRNPSKLAYHYGDLVELTATADPGWTFSQWSGAVESTANPVSLTILGDTNVIVTFAREEYTLTTSVVGGGVVSKDPDQAIYHYGDEVELTATADSGWIFSQWSGDVEGTDNPVLLTMDVTKTVTATFTQYEYTVVAYTAGEGDVIKDPDQPTYHYGDTVLLTAVPAAGWGFREWSGDVASSDNPLELYIDGNKTVFAVFESQDYQVSVSLAGEGSGSVTSDPAGISCPGDCTEPYTYGTVVTLTATPAVGSTFAGWSGACTGTGTCVVTVDAGKTVVATFDPIPYDLTINQVGAGSVSKSPNQATYRYGDVVQLTAVAAPCWVFTGWSGDLVSSQNPAFLTIDGDMTVVANFAEVRYTLTTSVVGNGEVQRDPDQLTYGCDEAVLLTAVADPGWTFDRWSGALSGSANPTLLTMDGDKTVTATFVQDEYTLTINKVGSGDVSIEPDKTTYHYGDVVELTAVPARGWTFSDWSGGVQGSENPVILTIHGDTTVLATFTQNQYTLTINIVGLGQVNKNPDKNTYSWNEEVELTAVGATGWTFDHWSGAVEGTDNPANLRMDGDKTVTVTFIEARTLTVQVVGGGSVDIDPPGSVFPLGEEVTLTAFPDPGWLFKAWAGDLSGSENPATVIMDANMTISAEFVRLIYLPSILRNWPPFPGVPTLYAIDNPDGLRSYTIRWSSALHAGSYVLEEATDTAFADAHQIYAGSSTSRTVSERMTGRHYYRVKGRNAWGDSDWSVVQSADVRWEVEPNDEIDQPNGPVVSGLTYYGIFPGADDVKDYFCFELTAPHRVQIWLSNIPAGRNYDLVLRKQDASSVAYSLNPGNADEYIDIPTLAPGFYYVQIYRTSGAGSSEPYHLRIVFQ